MSHEHDCSLRGTACGNTSIHIQSRPMLMHVALPDVSMLTLITIQIDLMEITNLFIKD